LEAELKEKVGEDSPIIRDALAERVIGRFPTSEYRPGFMGLSNYLSIVTPSCALKLQSDE
jgi:hypothetical protein